MTVDKGTPTSLSSVLSPDFYAYRRPKSKISTFIWRRRMWVESTFGLSLLEPWEKLLVFGIWSLLMIVIITGAVKYLPQHLYFMQRRAMYYLLGREGDMQDLLHRAGEGWTGTRGFSSMQEL